MNIINLSGPVVSEFEKAVYDEMELSSISSKAFIQELQKYQGEDVSINLYSTGGSVFEGMAIYDAIKSYPGKVKINITSLAASIATLIAISADEVTMSSSATFMIHLPSIDYEGRIDTTETDKVSRMLESTEKNIIKLYKDKTGLPDEKIKALLKDETWMTAEEAKELGFVDNIIVDAFQMVASSDAKDTLKNLYKEKIKEDEELKASLKAKLENLFNAKDEVVEEEVQEEVVENEEVQEEIEVETTEETTEKVVEETTEETVEEEKEATGEDEELDEILFNAIQEIQNLREENASLKDKVEELSNSAEKSKAKLDKADMLVDKLNTLLNDSVDKMMVVNTEKETPKRGRFNFGGK